MVNSIRVIEPHDIFEQIQSAKLCQDVEQLVTNDIEVIILDFKNVSFIDSAGLGTLVHILTMTREAEVQLLLCSLNEQVQNFFELTDMDRLFPIFQGREELEYKIHQANLRK